MSRLPLCLRQRRHARCRGDVRRRDAQRLLGSGRLGHAALGPRAAAGERERRPPARAAAGERAAAMPEEAPRISRVRVAAFAAFAAGTGLAVLALPGLDQVRARIAGADPGWLAVAGVLELGSCLAFLLALRGVMGAPLGWALSARVGWAVQGTNVLLPSGGVGGLALAAWVLRRVGHAPAWIARRTVTLFVATSSVNFFTALAGGALLAAGLLPGDVPTALAVGPAAAALLTAAVVAVAPRLLEARRLRLRGRLADGARRAVADGLRDVPRLVTERRHDAIAGSVGYMFLDLAALAAAFAAVGSPPELGVLLVAYPLGQLGGLVPLPGGVGGADGGLIAALALYGTPLATAAAAVLLYRLFQLGLPALVGVPAISGLPRALQRHGPAARARRRRAVAA